MQARDLLQMVSELHRMGYERARIEPTLSPSGCHWRCRIVPALLTSREHGARVDRARQVDCEDARYSSAEEGRPFGWTDADGAPPAELATKFLTRFPKLAQLTKGADPEYAAWYDEMLRATAPEGLVYAWADFPIPADCLPVLGRPQGPSVPLPPSAKSEPRGERPSLLARLVAGLRRSRP